MGTDTASAQHIVAVLRTKMKSRKALKFDTIFAIKHHHILLDARMGKVRQFLRASTARQICAAIDTRVA